MSGHATKIATAPVSFGIFGSATKAHTPREVVAAMAAAGYPGAELGPPALFGSPSETAQLFDEFSMQAIGAYAGVHFAGTQEQFETDLVQLERTSAELVATTSSGFLILADEGDDATRANPARSNDHPVAWDHAQWDVVASRVNELVDQLRARGLTPSFHPHIGTYVENQREIELLLERTTVDLTLDTGHFLLGGVDPIAALADYAGRVNHVHIKDVHVDRIPAPELTLDADLDDWWGDISSPLGEGDVDLSGFLAAAGDQQFDWFVIEQDRDPAAPGSLEGISNNEQANRRWLEDAMARTVRGSKRAQNPEHQDLNNNKESTSE